MKKTSDFRLWLGMVGLFFLFACSGGGKTGPGDVRWDRVSCERCIMSVSDRNFSAQIRGAEAGKKTRLYFFDDFGCAAIWLQEQPWRDDPRTEIWVTHSGTGQWLDARSAAYDTGFITSMDYGLGAVDGPGDRQGKLSFGQAVQVVMKIEGGPRLRGGETAPEPREADTK